MAELDTDEEKVEAIKRWWKANGVAVIGGVVIGLGVVIGWRSWVEYRTNLAQRGSIAFEQLLITAQAGDTASAQKQVDGIVDDFGSTPYAMFAELTRARLALADGDPAGAETALRAAMDLAPDPALASLAALRLAQVQLDRGELAAAADTVKRHGDAAAFAGDFAALRGDIAAAEGRLKDARAAYQAALDAGAGNARLIELKLQDLPPDETS
jgi:predicted negative regulator of RcsB-dependent stress response